MSVHCPSYDTGRIVHLELDSNAAFRSFGQGQRLKGKHLKIQDVHLWP